MAFVSMDVVLICCGYFVFVRWFHQEALQTSPAAFVWLPQGRTVANRRNKLAREPRLPAEHIAIDITAPVIALYDRNLTFDCYNSYVRWMQSS